MNRRLSKSELKALWIRRRLTRPVSPSARYRSTKKELPSDKYAIVLPSGARAGERCRVPLERRWLRSGWEKRRADCSSAISGRYVRCTVSRHSSDRSSSDIPRARRKPSSIPVGTNLAHFVVLELLGRGGFGEVYR